MTTTSRPADKARASAKAALECVNKKVDPSCTECLDVPPVRAVIMFPNLGTPLILPPNEKKVRFFIAAEEKSKSLFGVAPGARYPQPAALGYMYVDKHLRVYPISGKELKADTKEGRLWNDGKTCSTAFKHVKVWCLGQLNDGTIKDKDGKLFANVRPSAIDSYRTIRSAHHDRNDPLTKNLPLKWLYQIEIDLDALPNRPSGDHIVSLAWMIDMPASYKKQKDLAGMTDWEYQDKLIYDFLEAQKRDPAHNHFPDLYEFDVMTATPSKLPKLKHGGLKRLKSWHPVSIGKKASLKIGHLSDVHVNSRQFVLASSNACVLEGISDPLGTKVDNCFMSLKELFENMKDAGADALFLTGDLLDFNRNMDPREVKSGNPIDQYPLYDLAKNIENGKLYPRGIDDMLIFSLLRYSYEKLNLPVFLTTGNHEAYDVPYGISPRVNGFMVKGVLEQAKSDNSVVIPARLPVVQYAIEKTADAAQRAKKHLVEWGGGNVIDDYTRRAQEQAEKKNLNLDPNALPTVIDKKTNEGIPADHNLTIYEACLIYGPSFPQVIKPFNFTPKNYDWFFTLFTPLCDYRIDYNDQVLVGLDWGDSEIMINTGISLDEIKETPREKIMGALQGLPRADKSLNEKQKDLIEEARRDGLTGHRVALFTHFTLINYDNPVPIGQQSDEFAASDNVFNDFTKGTFSRGRDWLYPKLNYGIHFTMAGHSHRSGVYRLQNKNHKKMSAIGYHPAEYKQSAPTSAQMHQKMFSDPWTTRVVVSSCGGPIGTQNIQGELFGWNLMPPSGTLLDMDADGPLQLQRIATKEYKQGKPRFCVALDYVQNHLNKMIISWIPDNQGFHLMVVGNVMDAKDFIAKVTFYVWIETKRQFKKFDCVFNPSMDQGYVCRFYFNDPKAFSSAALANADEEAKIVFAKIDFNDVLSKHPLYSQYNFKDPWIVRVEVTSPFDNRFSIKVAEPGVAQLPDWKWLPAVAPGRYPAISMRK